MAKKTTNRLNLSKKLLLAIVLILILMIAAFAASYLYLLDRIYPGVSVAGINLSIQKKEVAKQTLSEKILSDGDRNLSLRYNNQSFDIKISLEKINLNLEQAIDQAFEYGHTKVYLPPQNIYLKIASSPNLTSQLKQIALSVNQPAIDSTLKIEDDQINVTPSQDGLVLDEERVKTLIEDIVNGKEEDTYSLPLKKTSPKLSYDAALEIKKRLDEIKLSPLKLTFKDQVFVLNLEQLIGLIDLENSDSSLFSTRYTERTVTITSLVIDNQETKDSKISLNKEKTASYLKTLSHQIDQPVEEPLFNFDPLSPTKVREFRPPQEGRKLNIEESSDKILTALQVSGKENIELVVEVVPAQNKLTNELGIKELVGQGTSNFAGSIENRIYNLKLAASRINGVLIKPGEVFSFVNTIGDITAATGYKQAYVIKSGRTVLDDGGGVCQVSTTLFRAVLNSGLPIVARTAHAYRVGYYEQGYPPGLDATIYYPSVDFKFKNDTEKSLLIQAYSTGYYLYVDFYGTSDGRVATVSKPLITNSTPPPAELRQDDPTLPKGTVKQVDWPAWGANVSFNRTVTKNGQTIINETFRSNYRPWQAVYLVGTGG